MSDNYRPRLSIELSQQQANDLRALIPWGLKNQLFSVLVDDVIKLGRRYGQNFLAAILARTITLDQWADINLNSEDQNNDSSGRS
jgi:hypothetical protein